MGGGSGDGHHMGTGERYFDVIVVGVGSMGSAACAHLAARGARVLGLEQFEIPHRHGSHHGHSRMIRQAYYEHPDYVPLLRRAYQLWDELQLRDGGREFFYRTGGIYLGPEEGAIVSGSLGSAREHGLEHQLHDAGEVQRRFPQFRPGGGHLGFFENEAGFLVPELAIMAHAAWAREGGASLLEGEALVSWGAAGSGVEVKTAAGVSYQADHLVFAGGAWSSQLVAGLGVELAVTRQVLAWFEPLGDRGRFAPGRFPCWFVETEPPYGHYGFPVLPGDPGLKVALHRPGEPIAPGQLRTAGLAPREAEIDRLHAVLDEFLPGCAGELSQACTCLYTNSPDGHFVVGHHPEFEQVSVACGFSGHGFKFASVMGEALADLALDGGTELPIGFLGPGRFVG